MGKIERGQQKARRLQVLGSEAITPILLYERYKWVSELLPNPHQGPRMPSNNPLNDILPRTPSRPLPSTLKEEKKKGADC
jgi:hypothetical protein